MLSSLTSIFTFLLYELCNTEQKFFLRSVLFLYFMHCRMDTQTEEHKCLYLIFRETLVLCYNSTHHTFHKNRELKCGVKIHCIVILKLIFLTQHITFTNVKFSPSPTLVCIKHLPNPEILPCGTDTLVKSMAGFGSGFQWNIVGSYLDTGTYFQEGNMQTTFCILKSLMWQTRYFWKYYM